VNVKYDSIVRFSQVQTHPTIFNFVWFWIFWIRCGGFWFFGLVWIWTSLLHVL